MPTQYKKNPNEDTAYFDGHKVNLIAVPAGTLQLPIHPTSDSGYVVDNNGKKHRVLMATFISGTVDYKSSPTADSAYVTINGQKVKVRLAVKENGALTLSDKPNVDKGYVVGDDSEKHRVTLINTPTGTLELPNNETDDSAYIIDGNGNKIKVRMFALLSGGYVEVTVKGVSPLSLPDAIADSLSYVKAFGGTEQRNLPDNYLQRQFIYMMDGSYIKVEDLPISAGYRIEFDFQTLTLSSPLRNYLGGRVGGVAAGGGFRLSKLASGGSTLNRVCLYGFESGTEYYAPEQFQADTRYKYTYDNGVCTLESGGSVVGTKTFTVTDDTSTDWGINTYGSTYWQTDSDGIYVYSLKVWNDQGELVMDLVPAVQKGTVPVVGFYDTVTGGFRTPTAGTFAAGGEAVPTPDAPMDIVCNNGVLKYSRNKVNVIADNVVVGKYISAQGVLSYSEYNFTYMPYVPVKPNTTYTLSFSSPLYFASVSEYSSAEDSGFVVRQTKYSTSLDTPFDLTEFTFTTGATTNYVRFGSNMYKNQALTIDDVLAVNYMLAESATAVPYAPYVSDNGGIYTDGTVETIAIKDDQSATVSSAVAEMLLKIGDIADQQEIIGGTVTRKVGIKVLDGTEDWTYTNSRFRIRIADYLVGSSIMDTIISHYKLPAINVGSIANGEARFGKPASTDTVSSDNILIVHDDNYTDLNGYKAWLAAQYAAGTPVIIVYPLSTATTETVTGQTLQVQAGDNVLEITQASLNNLELEAEYKKNA